MMKVLNYIFNQVEQRAFDIEAKDVRIGLGYTAVLLENDQAGLAYTIRDDLPEGCSVFRGKHPLSGQNARELLLFLKSDQSIEVSLGLATVNALINYEKQGIQNGDVLQQMGIRSTDQVGMVGLFSPLVNPLKKKAASLKIFEKNPKRHHEDMLGLPYMKEVLPQCQVALITSTALLNHTLDEILDLSRDCREVVLLGPSTPLIPDVFTKTPVTCLAGVIVVKPQEILRIVSEGGGMRDFHDAVTKVHLRI